jgi:hypothetical protein
MFNLSLRNSSYTSKSVFFLVRVLVKARLLDAWATDSKPQAVVLTTADEQTYVQTFSPLVAIGVEK